MILFESCRFVSTISKLPQHYWNKGTLYTIPASTYYTFLAISGLVGGKNKRSSYKALIFKSFSCGLEGLFTTSCLVAHHNNNKKLIQEATITLFDMISFLNTANIAIMLFTLQILFIVLSSTTDAFYCCTLRIVVL